MESCGAQLSSSKLRLIFFYHGLAWRHDSYPQHPLDKHFYDLIFSGYILLLLIYPNIHSLENPMSRHGFVH